MILAQNQTDTKGAVADKVSVQYFEKDPAYKGELYLSWGYNKEWYTHSDVKVSQPSIGNDYVLNNVAAHDHPGWDYQLLQKAISIPQYNYRLGYFFKGNSGWGWEVNFDHTKLILSDGQRVQLTGTMEGKKIDTSLVYSAQNGFFYFLNNGANFLLFNAVHRWKWVSDNKERIKIYAIAKAGIGPVIPHVENSFFFEKNKPHFQLGGWNTGLEGDIRVVFYKYAYLEYANKVDYARYSGLRIAQQGTASQAFATYEMILSVGVCFPIGK